MGLSSRAVSEEAVTHIFERLHGVDEYSGTGIGLAVVRKGISRIGGQVGVECAPGLGSRFWPPVPRART